MRFVIAILIAISVAWGSVAGVMAQTSVQSYVASMSDCAGKAMDGCPCKHAGFKCAKASCAQVCDQVLGVFGEIHTVVQAASIIDLAAVVGSTDGLTPGFEPPIPKN